MNITVTPSTKLKGEIKPTGDKSISHRSIILNSIAKGVSRISNFGYSQDCISTIKVMQALGSDIQFNKNGVIRVIGTDNGELQESSDVLNVGNSGTTARLIAGTLAGRKMLSVITGDESLRNRPMKRIIDPLQDMGANISGRGGNWFAPLVLNGGTLLSRNHNISIASAQVKSALLLAGLRTDGTTTVNMPYISRDHTERMLQVMGADVKSYVAPDGSSKVTISKSNLVARDVEVPGDISSAAYWIVAAIAHPNAEITLKNVGLNPTRTGILKVLKQMGADITIENQKNETGEPVGDIVAKSSNNLSGVQIKGEIIPSVIDEIPLIALAAVFAKGDTEISDAKELRVKESDRISATVEWLTKAGVPVTEKSDGMIISGVGHICGGTYRSHHDHRIAMSIGIAGILADASVTVVDAEVTKVSYERFWQDAQTIGAILS